MRLRSLCVSGVGCFVEPFTLGPLGDGVIVVHAPNGTGKSTLLEALSRAMFDRYNSRAEPIAALRPWGRALAPTVVVHMAHRGVEYELTKRFLDQPHCTLKRLENGRWTSLAERDQADETLRDFFDAQEPTNRGSTPDRRGLAQVLWAEQGDLGLGELSGPLSDRLRRSMNLQMTSTEADRVIRAIDGCFSTIYTKKRKEYVSGGNEPPVARLEREVTGLEADLTQARQAAEQFAELSQQVQELRDQRAQREVMRLEARRQLDGVAERAGRVQSVTNQLRETTARADAAEQRWNRLNERQTRITALRDQSEKTQVQLDQFERQAPALGEQVESMKLALLAQTRAAREAADRLTARAELARDWLGSRTRAGELTERIGQIEAYDRTIADLEKRRAAVTAPDKETLAALARAHEGLRAARVDLQASLITLSITPDADGAVEVLEGDTPGLVGLTRSRETLLLGSPRVSVRVKGLGVVRASGPAGSIEQLRTKVRTCEDALTRLATPLGTSDVDKLKQLAEQAAELDGQINTAKTARDTLLGRTDLAAMRRELGVIANRLDEIDRTEPTWTVADPDADALRRQAAADRTDAITQETAAQALVRQKLQALADAEMALSTQQVEARSRHDRLAELRRELRSAESGQTDAQRQDQLAAAALQHSGERAQRRNLERQLEEMGGDPSVELQRRESDLQALQLESNRLSEREHEAVGRLNQVASNGSGTKLADVTERLATTRAAYQHEKLRADAIRLLHEVVTLKQQAITDVMIGPVGARATDLLSRIAGPRLGRVVLDERLSATAVRPESVDADKPIDLFSGGECEQLHLAVRLALAEQLCGDDGGLLVLDDPLTATDSGRLYRVQQLLEQVAQKMQVLIFTCHPERYGAIRDVCRIDLAEARSRA